MAFPNDPGTGTLILDWPFNQKTGSPPFSTNGNGFITTDTGDPHSPPNVCQMDYPVGFPAGIGPDNIYVGMGSATEGYIGHTWMCNAGWQQEVNSQTSKIGFFISNGIHDLFWGMTGPQGGPYRIRLSHEIAGGTGVINFGQDSTYNLEPNVSTVSIFSGTWYTIEIYYKFSTTKSSGNGIIRWWVNGTLVGNYTSLNFNTDLVFNQGQLSPTWGGANNTKTQNDYYRFGHFRVRVPSGGVVPPPPAPTISSFTPTSGSAGTPLTIVGTNFDTNPGGNSVTLNGTACTILGAQSTQINTSVPNTATTGRIQVTTSAGSATSASDFTVTTVIPPPTGTGSLSGSRATPANTTLSTEGTVDWAHWGLSLASSYNDKSGGAGLSNVTDIGVTRNRYIDNPTAYSWTGGTPTASASNTTTGVYFEGVGSGFTLTAPADTNERILKVYSGCYNANMKMTAVLSDNSAASYTDNGMASAAVAGGTNAVWTFRYKAGEASQTLTVSGTVTSFASSNFGNVTLQAATLQLVNPPVEVITLSLSDLTIQEGMTGQIILTINPVRTTDSVIALSVSNSAVISVPSTITIPASSSSTIVSISALTPGSSTITATLGTATTTSTVTVTSTPVTPVSPSVPNLNLYTGFLDVYRWM